MEINVPEGLVLPATSTDVTNIRWISDSLVRLEIPACMQPQKGTVTVSAPAARVSRAHFDRPLIGALRRAHRELSSRGVNPASRSGVDQARGLPDPYLRRIAALAFLAPDIQQSILAGRQPPGLTLKRLTNIEIPLDWKEQRLRLGFNHS